MRSFLPYLRSPTAAAGLRRPGARLGLLLLVLLAAGCSPWQYVRIADDNVLRFVERQVVPRALAGYDLHVDCAAAAAFNGPTLVFERLGSKTERMGILLWMGAALCAEQQAMQQELTYLRALHQRDPERAQDARLAQKRLHALAATREYHAWQLFQKLYRNPTPENCPRFRNETDELSFLVGLVAGLMSTVNAVQAGPSVSIPRELAPQAVRLASCVDDEKWWHLPSAMRAALWHAVPMFAPEQLEEPPMVTLRRIANQGKLNGVRLGHAVWALVAANGGDHESLRQALGDFTDLPPGWQPDPAYRIIDVVAGEFMLALSDRHWTEKTGHRTPIGALGYLPDNLPGSKRADISDLLE